MMNVKVFWLWWATLSSLSLNSNAISVDMFERLRPASQSTTEEQSGNVTEQWLEQLLDHFSPVKNTTWKQRYFSNLLYYDGVGPVFIFIGGEEQTLTSWLSSGLMMMLAEEHHAATYMLEHRFYGESKPTPNVSTENLEYLTAEQALADIAYFITYLREKGGFIDNKVILFGRSYAANLAAWARMKYPHLVNAALASSAPVRAKTEFYEYYDVVTYAIEDKYPECVTTIREATTEMKRLLQSPEGAANLTKQFQLCSSLNVSDNNQVSALFDNVASVVGSAVQYNMPVDVEHDALWSSCNYITDSQYGSSSLSRYSNIMKRRMGNSCLLVDMASVVSRYRDTSWTGKATVSGGRQWMYQTCTQFGFYQTSKSSVQPFGEGMFPLEYKLYLCKEVFGENFDEVKVKEGVRRTNILYGAENPLISNVLFTHGSRDPWSYLGIKDKKSPFEELIVIEGGWHCSDMSDETEFDSPQLLEAREKIKEVVRKWINETTML